ncbi:MAG: aldo/keto reductase [Firmicutes bacterium]|nr:aldo/keto reductase [Bacillota bacterium]
MEMRRLGRIGHMSSVVLFGAASLGEVTQDQADQSIQFALDAGINHFDTAASYGEAELRMGPWMPKIRKQIFLATKTGDRDRDSAWHSIERSLKRLQVDDVDLIQLHAVTSFEELDLCTRAGGALEALIQAKEQGLVKQIGITGHGHLAPAVHLEALRRFPFATVLTPLNFILENNEPYRTSYEALVAEVKRQDAGLMTIKTVARGPWPTEDSKRYATWYEPFDEQAYINQCVSFVLSHPEVTGLASAGDVRLLPKIVEAVSLYRQMGKQEREDLMATAGAFASPFGPF